MITWKNHFIYRELEARIRSLTRRKFVQRDVCPEQWGHKVRYKKREAYAKKKRGAFDQKKKVEFWNICFLIRADR